MKFIEQKDLDPIAVLNEYDVHNILCVARQALLRECSLDDDEAKAIMSDQCGCVDHIMIVPKRPELFTSTMIAQWESRMNELFDLIVKLDGLIHEDAEYTC